MKFNFDDGKATKDAIKFFLDRGIYPNMVNLSVCEVSIYDIVTLEDIVELKRAIKSPITVHGVV